MYNWGKDLLSKKYYRLVKYIYEHEKFQKLLNTLLQIISKKKKKKLICCE